MRMTASELKYRHEENFPDSLFFSRNNMKFAGDTMANFAVLPDTCEIVTPSGNIHTCYELIRKRKTSKGFSGTFYFDVETFQRIHSAL